MHDPEVKQQVITWLLTSKTIREPKTKAGLARKLNITHPTINNWERELKKGYNRKVDKVIDELAQFDDLQIQQFMKRVYQRAMEPTSPAAIMELYAKLKGLLIDRTETTHKFEISADELTKEVLRAERELRGMAEVQFQPTILSGDLLLSSGQGAKGDN